MNKHVLFVQGGEGEEDYAAGARLVASLQEVLGENYLVHYPLLRDEPVPDFGRKEQIGKEISSIRGEIILAGHSLGASSMDMIDMIAFSTKHNIESIVEVMPFSKMNEAIEVV